MSNPTRLSDVPEVPEKIERVRQHRRHKFYLRDERITLSHGSGGKATHNLIEGIGKLAVHGTINDLAMK